MLTVVTGWSPSGWNEYGRRFAESFDRFWPCEIRLLVYGEEPRELPNRSGRREIEFRPLTAIPGCIEFLDRNDNELARGLRQLANYPWKPSAIAAGYNWRFDAWKFCRQGFIPEHAARSCGESDFLIWLDGDVVTHSPVDLRAIEALLPAGKAIAYLGRGAKHPEIGFQMYRVGDALPMLEEFARLYREDAVFNLPEWHSAYVWREALRQSGLSQFAHDLTPGGTGHVWHQSPLRLWGDHLKGDRKKLGKSPERRR